MEDDYGNILEESDFIPDAIPYGSVGGIGQKRVASSRLPTKKDLDDIYSHTRTFIISPATFALRTKQAHYKKRTLEKYHTMSDKNNESIKVVGEPKDGVLTILRGVAPEPNNPSPVRISGHIDAPFRYFKLRKGKTFETDTAHLEVNAKRKEVKLFCDPSDDLAPVITGSIHEYAPLVALKINDSSGFTKEMFKDLMKKNRFLFKKASDCTELVAKLMNLDIQVEAQLKENKDDRGSESVIWKQTCETTLPESIVLECPIFVEGDKQEIRADLRFKVNASAELTFWLESPELFQTIEDQTTEMIADTVADFGDEIVIIYQ